MVKNGQRWCPSCRRLKAARDFYRNRANADGHDSMCKSCRREYQAARYLTERQQKAPAGDQARGRLNQSPKGSFDDHAKDS